MMEYEPLVYQKNQIKILNQLLLPSITEYETYSDYIDILDAINAMKIRGTALVGIAAGYGLLISLNNKTFANKKQFKIYYENIKKLFLKTRESIRSLSYIFEVFDEVINSSEIPFDEVVKVLEKNAILFEKKEFSASDKITELAVNRVFNNKKSYKFLTLGNYGRLSTGGIGNTTGLFKKLLDAGVDIEVYIDETRPHFQGSRLTAWELKNNKIPYTIITAGEVAKLINDIGVDAVVIGAEQIASNGDVISKIGSLSMALIARYYQVPVFVLASTTTINPLLKTAEKFVTESCKTDEILLINGIRTAPVGSKILNYSFDMIPASLITAIITEEGIITPINL